jgi:hypothetical protein
VLNFCGAKLLPLNCAQLVIFLGLLTIDVDCQWLHSVAKCCNEIKYQICTSLEWLKRTYKGLCSTVLCHVYDYALCPPCTPHTHTPCTTCTLGTPNTVRTIHDMHTKHTMHTMHTMLAFRTMHTKHTMHNKQQISCCVSSAFADQWLEETQYVFFSHSV